MFKIENGREAFYQWDKEQRLVIEDASITEVHFCNRTDDCSLCCEVFEEDGKNLVNVPNILLQNDWDINVYGYDTNYTKHAARFKVNRRTKPADYVYTETEICTVEGYVEKALQEAKESGEFDGPVGPQGPSGAIKFIPVLELPTDNIDTNAIYLVPTKNTDEQNNYEEFVNIYGVWESLGVIPVATDLSEYVKKTQFADRNGNAGVLRLKSGYGISSGRYDGNSPIDGDTIYISKASDNQIKYKSGDYNPIVPTNLDYAVKMALAGSKITWTQAERRAALKLLNGGYLVKLAPLFENDTMLSEDISLERGKTYEVVYRVNKYQYKATLTPKDNNAVPTMGTTLNLDCVFNINGNTVHKYVYSVSGMMFFYENDNYEEGTVRYVSVKEL